LVLLLVGLVGGVVATFMGFGSLFAWNGRHAVDVVPLGEGPTSRKLVTEPGRRYTVSVQVVFDREGLPKREGVTVVEATMPLVVRVKDPAGTVRAEVTGWLDPNEPPNVLYGQAAHEARSPHPSTPTHAGMPELVVERLVGPFISSDRGPLDVNVDLGPDRIGVARVLERRLVIYDDTLPPNIRNAFIVAGAGVAAFIAGAALIVVGWFRRRGTTRKRRGGIRRPDVV
jgi:hypothetical protein